MTIWTPELGGEGSKATRIVDAIAADIADGRLAAGERLPPQRDLAYRLAVSVGTVTRAYAEAERRGLVSATVGRGTYVRDRARPETTFDIGGGEAVEGVIDLSANLARCDARRDAFDDALRAMQGTAGASALLEYMPSAGLERHRAAGAAWIGRAGIEADPDRVVVCQGAQQALAVAFSTLTRPGDAVLTEALTFPPVKLLATMFRFRLHGVALDREGLMPEALDAAARATSAKLLYLIPTYQNPTGVTMSEARRREIARIAERHDLQIVEDDVYGPLADPAPPAVARFAAPRTWYVTSVSKCLAPGLRVGYLLCPDDRTDPFVGKVRAFGWVNAPLCAEIAARWIGDGTADRLIEWHRRENVARWTLAVQALGEIAAAATEAPHLWLDLPEPWDGRALAAETLRRGVRLAEGDAFAATRDAGRHFARVSLNAARGRDELRTALTTIADCLASQPAAASGIL